MAVASTVAGVAVAGATAYSARKASSSAKKSAQTIAESTDASVGEQRRQLDVAREDLAPWRTSGTNALNALHRLYGLPQVDTAPKPEPAPAAAPAPVVPRHEFVTARIGGGGRAGNHMFRHGGVQLMQPQAPATPAPVASAAPPAPAPIAAPAAPQDRYGGFMASPGYQFRLDEGLKGVQNSAAARGRLFSGATLKGVNNYAQNVASEEFNNYANALRTMAGLGQTSASQSAAGALATGQSIGQALQYGGAQRASAFQQGAAGMNAAIQGGVGNLAYLYGYRRG